MKRTKHNNDADSELQKDLEHVRSVLDSFEGFETLPATSCYNPDDHPRMAEVACSELGADEKKLAKLFGIGQKTLTRWQRRYEDFRAAVERGRDFFDTTSVERALVSLCTGYYYTEKTYEFVHRRDPESGEVVSQRRVLTKEEVRHVKPESRAIEFWLSNRQSDRWKRTKHVDVSGETRNLHLHKHEETGEIKPDESTNRRAEVLDVLVRSGAIPSGVDQSTDAEDGS